MENKQSGEFVAVKRIKRLFKSWEECMQLRELSSLRKLKQHPNIVQLKEIVREQQQLNFVFEFMKDGTLLNDMQKRAAPHSEGEVRHIMRQVLAGLEMCHKNNFFHRDIKPENLLMLGTTVKIADFGCAREIRSRPPFTDYVSTRWYRAPELLLRSTVYNSPVDMWACGCIMAELFAKRNLFPGKNDIDTLFKIVNILGTPNSQTWPEGLRMAKAKGINFPNSSGIHLQSIMPNASEDALRLMTDLLKYDSNKRPSSVQALNYPFFSKHPDTTPASTIPSRAPAPQSVPQSQNTNANTNTNANANAGGSTQVFELGQRIEGRYGARDNWYGGVISAKRLHDTYDIDYDDGDKEMSVHAALIRPPQNGGGGGGGGSNASSGAPAQQQQSAMQAAAQNVRVGYQQQQSTYQPVTLGQYSQQHTYPASNAVANTNRSPSTNTYSGGGANSYQAQAGGGPSGGGYKPQAAVANASKWQNYGKPAGGANADPGTRRSGNRSGRSANRSGARDSAGRRKIGYGNRAPVSGNRW